MDQEIKTMVQVDNNEYYNSIHNYAVKTGLEDNGSQELKGSTSMIENCDDALLQQVCIFGTLGALDSDNVIESVSASYFIRNNLDCLSHNTIISTKSIIRGRLRDHISDINNNGDRLYRKHWKITYKALKQKDKEIRKEYRAQSKHKEKETKNLIRKELTNTPYRNLK